MRVDSPVSEEPVVGLRMFFEADGLIKVNVSTGD